MSTMFRGSVEVTVIREGRLLAVTNANNQVLFSSPGGKLDPGESLEQAARRELLEETGCTAVSIVFIAGATLPGVPGKDPPGSQWYRAGFVADIGDQTPIAQPGQSGAVAWISPEVLMTSGQYPAFYSWWIPLLRNLNLL